MSRTLAQSKPSNTSAWRRKKLTEGTHLTGELLAVDDSWKKNGWVFFFQQYGP